MVDPEPARAQEATHAAGSPRRSHEDRRFCPYFHPYNCPIPAVTRRTGRHETRTGQHLPAPVRPPAGTTQIYEGTNQIQRMVIARKTFGNVR
jgi:alkylation response protein AidB-like acyl-CoA dehydrogenase